MCWPPKQPPDYWTMSTGDKRAAIHGALIARQAAISCENAWPKLTLLAEVEGRRKQPEQPRSGARPKRYNSNEFGGSAQISTRSDGSMITRRSL
jgi:hypothetical protein